MISCPQKIGGVRDKCGPRYCYPQEARCKLWSFTTTWCYRFCTCFRWNLLFQNLFVQSEPDWLCDLPYGTMSNHNLSGLVEWSSPLSLPLLSDGIHHGVHQGVYIGVSASPPLLQNMGGFLSLSLLTQCMWRLHSNRPLFLTRYMWRLLYPVPMAFL